MSSLRFAIRAGAVDLADKRSSLSGSGDPQTWQLQLAVPLGRRSVLVPREFKYQIKGRLIKQLSVLSERTDEEEKNEEDHMEMTFFFTEGRVD